MKRAVVIAMVVVTVAIVAVARGGGGESSYRFAVVFDDAKGMGPGMIVKLAGARAGTVEDVKLTAQHKARVILSIPERLAPLRADARCRILPQGLIAEYYVECDVGTSRRALASSGGLPTVPVEHTQSPVALQDVIDVFSAPVDQRLQVLVAELGLGTSARGEDLDAIVRRADPALQDGQRLLRILNGQRRKLDDAVAATDRVVSRLAGDRRDVRRFVSGAGRTLATTAMHRRALAVTVGRLPGLLRAGDRGLTALDGATTRLTPLLRDVRAATPALRSAVDALPLVTAAAKPAITQLAPTARALRRTIRMASPLVKRLGGTARTIAPTIRTFAQLAVSVRDAGGFEHIERLTAAFALATGSYDGTSHMATILLEFVWRCILDPRASGCNRTYGSPGAGNIPINDPNGAPQPETFVDAPAHPSPQAITPAQRRRLARLLLQALPPAAGGRR